MQHWLRGNQPDYELVSSSFMGGMMKGTVKPIKSLLLILIFFLISIAMVGATGQDEAGSEAGTSDGPEFTFRAAGTVTANIDYIQKLYYGFADKVEEYSEGRIKVDLYLGTLGGEREVLEMLQQGLIEVTLISDSTYSIFEPKWGIMDLPFFISTREEAQQFTDGEGGEKLSELMISRGFRVLAYADNGMRQVSNSVHEIRVPEDLKGLKIRIPENPAISDWFRSVGADPTIIPFPELFPALQQGVADGQENSMVIGSLLHMDEVQKFWTDTNHDYSSIPIAINENVWQSLPEDLQVVVKRAAKEAAADSRSAFGQAEIDSIEAMKAGGMQITLLSPEERHKYDITAKPIWKKYSKEFGDDFMDWAFDLVGKEWQ